MWTNLHFASGLITSLAIALFFTIANAQTPQTPARTSDSNSPQISARDAWTLFRSYRWPELRELSEEASLQSLAHTLNTIRPAGPAACDTFRVRGVQYFNSPFFRSKYQLLYISKGPAALTEVPSTVYAKVDNAGNITLTDPEMTKARPSDDMDERLKFIAATLNEDFRGEIVDSSNAIAAAIDIVTLLGYRDPKLFLDSFDEIAAYSKTVVGETFWMRVATDDSARALISSIRILGAGENGYFDASDYEENGLWYELNLPSKFEDVIKPPSCIPFNRGWKVELYLWTPRVGTIEKWIISFVGDAGFAHERLVLAQRIGFIFGE